MKTCTLFLILLSALLLSQGCILTGKFLQDAPFSKQVYTDVKKPPMASWNDFGDIEISYDANWKFGKPLLTFEQDRRWKVYSRSDLAKMYNVCRRGKAVPRKQVEPFTVSRNGYLPVVRLRSLQNLDFECIIATEAIFLHLPGKAPDGSDSKTYCLVPSHEKVWSPLTYPSVAVILPFVLIADAVVTPLIYLTW